MRAFLVNGFPGVSTNTDLLAAARSLGFAVERVSAIANFATSDQEFSFAALEDLLVDKISGVPHDEPCVIIGFCFGAWLSARALARTGREPRSHRVVLLAPLLSLRSYTDHHGIQACRENLFLPAKQYLKGAPADWEAEWLRLAEDSSEPIYQLRSDLTLLSSVDAELDERSQVMARELSRSVQTIRSDSHFFDNGREALRGALAEYLTSVKADAAALS